MHPSQAIQQRADMTQTIRAALQRKITTGSLRAVAREIGMSASGLSGFLEGAEPYGPTFTKLQRWYFDHAGENERRQAMQAAAALRTLTAHLSPRRARAAGARMLAALAEESAGAELPWLKELQARMEQPGEGVPEG